MCSTSFCKKWVTGAYLASSEFKNASLASVGLPKREIQEYGSRGQRALVLGRSTEWLLSGVSTVENNLPLEVEVD